MTTTVVCGFFPRNRPGVGDPFDQAGFLLRRGTFPSDLDVHTRDGNLPLYLSGFARHQSPLKLKTSGTILTTPHPLSQPFFLIRLQPEFTTFTGGNTFTVLGASQAPPLSGVDLEDRKRLENP